MATRQREKSYCKSVKRRMDEKPDLENAVMSILGRCSRVEDCENNGKTWEGCILVDFELAQDNVVMESCHNGVRDSF